LQEFFCNVRTTSARDKTGFYGFWSLITALVIIYIANIFGSPPDEFSIGVAGNASLDVCYLGLLGQSASKINE
jgi:hypothetical protein